MIPDLEKKSSLFPFVVTELGWGKDSGSVVEGEDKNCFGKKKQKNVANQHLLHFQKCILHYQGLEIRLK